MGLTLPWNTPTSPRARLWTLAFLAGGAVATPVGLQGQGVLAPDPATPDRPGPSAYVLGGVASYELHFDDDGEAALVDGEATVLGAGFDLPLASWLYLEPVLTRLSLSGADARSYGGGSRHRWQLEFGLRGEIAIAGVRPYLAAGVGAFFHIDGERPTDRDFATASYGAGGGVLIPLPGGIEVRAELRVRTFDDTDSRVVPLRVGAGWRF